MVSFSAVSFSAVSLVIFLFVAPEYADRVDTDVTEGTIVIEIIGTQITLTPDESFGTKENSFGTKEKTFQIGDVTPAVKTEASSLGPLIVEVLEDGDDAIMSAGYCGDFKTINVVVRSLQTALIESIKTAGGDCWRNDIKNLRVTFDAPEHADRVGTDGLEGTIDIEMKDTTITLTPDESFGTKKKTVQIGEVVQVDQAVDEVTVTTGANSLGPLIVMVTEDGDEAIMSAGSGYCGDFETINVVLRGFDVVLRDFETITDQLRAGATALTDSIYTAGGDCWNGEAGYTRINVGVTFD